MSVFPIAFSQFLFAGISDFWFCLCTLEGAWRTLITFWKLYVCPGQGTYLQHRASDERSHTNLEEVTVDIVKLLLGLDNAAALGLKTIVAWLENHSTSTEGKILLGMSSSLWNSVSDLGGKTSTTFACLLVSIARITLIVIPWPLPAYPHSHEVFLPPLNKYFSVCFLMYIYDGLCHIVSLMCPYFLLFVYFLFLFIHCWPNICSQMTNMCLYA